MVISSPIPWAAPVTTATLFVKLAIATLLLHIVGFPVCGLQEGKLGRYTPRQIRDVSRVDAVSNEQSLNDRVRQGVAYRAGEPSASRYLVAIVRMHRMLLAQGLEVAGWRLTPAATGRPASSVMLQARGSKGRKAQGIKPGLALLLLAVDVERIAVAGLDVARDPGVERRDLKAVTPALTPITNGRQGSFDEAARAPRPMPNPAPTSARDLRVDCSHMRTLNATELARVRRKGLTQQVCDVA